jgi:hypothetical protein
MIMIMSKLSVIKKAVLTAVALAMVGGVFAKNTTVEPTHYLFMPTARVNQPGDLVLGLHEISYAFPGKLQIQASILDNIGRLSLAAKYGFHRDLAGGVGLASTFIPGDFVENGSHGIPDYARARIGGFLAYEFGRPHYGLLLTGHAQIGDHISVGADLGGRITPSSVWSFLWEAGLSIDLNDKILYIYGIGGLRFNVAAPGLFVDVGAQALEFNLKAFGKGYPHAGMFFDIMYCFKP